MRHAALGAGAVGGFLAAALARAGAIRVERRRLAAGVTEQTSRFARLDVAPGEHADEIVAVLNRAGLAAAVGVDEQTVLWEKLVLLAPLALATTAAQGPIGLV